MKLRPANRTRGGETVLSRFIQWCDRKKYPLKTYVYSFIQKCIQRPFKVTTLVAVQRHCVITKIIGVALRFHQGQGLALLRVQKQRSYPTQRIVKAFIQLCICHSDQRHFLAYCLLSSYPLIDATKCRSKDQYRYCTKWKVIVSFVSHCLILVELADPDLQKGELNF